MKSLRAYIFPLLFVFLGLISRSFAITEAQDLTSYDAHFLTVQEYCQCLMAMASAEDIHELYNPKTIGGEIVRDLSPGDQQPHFLYGIAHGIDPHSPMLGLTELDAMRCCNWIETSLQDSGSTLASTETGSYLLRDDGTFETNDKAQLSLNPQNDGTFEVVSKVKKESTSPLMWSSIEGQDGRKRAPERFPGISPSENQTSLNRGKYDPLEGQSENQMGSSLKEIIQGNHDVHDDSLIGYRRSDDEGATGNYIAIKDISFYCLPLPAFIKDCLVNQETREQLMLAYTKVGLELPALMEASSAFIEEKKSRLGISGLEVHTNRVDWEKVKSVITVFNQSFNIYNLTRAKIRAFLEENGIDLLRQRKNSLTGSESLWQHSPRSSGRERSYSKVIILPQNRKEDTQHKVPQSVRPSFTLTEKTRLISGDR